MEQSMKKYLRSTELKVAWTIFSIVVAPIVLSVLGILIYGLYKCVTEGLVESLIIFGSLIILWAFFWACDTIAMETEREKE